MLEHAGVIVRIKGKGTYITPRKTAERIAGRLTGLHEEVAARGGVVTSDVLRQEGVPAPAHVAQQLGVEPEDEVSGAGAAAAAWTGSRGRCRRHGCRRGWEPCSPRADLRTESLYQVLEEQGAVAVQRRAGRGRRR